MVGGIATGIYLIAKNYEGIGDSKKKELTFIYGSIGTILLITIILYTNTKFSGIALSAGLGAGLSAFTKNLFQVNNIALKSKNLFSSPQNKELRQSGWHFLGATFGGIVVGVIVSLIIAFIFTAMGFKLS